jgi:hypothetical protein
MAKPECCPSVSALITTPKSSFSRLEVAGLTVEPSV